LARPRAVEPKTPICVKVTQLEKERLLAVAFADQSGLSGPSDVNLSQFIRDAMFDFVVRYEVETGRDSMGDRPDGDPATVGRDRLLENLHTAQLAEARAEVKAVAARARSTQEMADRHSPGRITTFGALVAGGVGTRADSHRSL